MFCFVFLLSKAQGLPHGALSQAEVLTSTEISQCTTGDRRVQNFSDDILRCCEVCVRIRGRIRVRVRVRVRVKFKVRVRVRVRAGVG